MFSLSTFESEGHSQNLFRLRNIQKDVTVISELDRRTQNCCFREGQVGMSTYFNTNRTFATFGQLGLQVRCTRRNFMVFGIEQFASSKKLKIDTLKGK